MAQREKYEPPEDRQLADVDRLSVMRLVETRPDVREQLPRDKLIDLAARIYDTRRTRSRYFHNNLFGEPVWDMLLALFCLPTARWRKMSVGGLSEAAGQPLTTSLRWLKVMEQKGLVERSPDPLDARRIFLVLTEKGDRLMCDYLTSIYHRMMDQEAVKP
jgi:DNA-binding MarR family transcriptional regulator